MLRIKWDDRYLVGIKQFDDDHKHLVGLLAELCERFVSFRRGDRETREVLDSLAAYTVTHFGKEEDWMRRNGYPRREQHLREHKEFISRLSGFQRDFQDGSERLTLDIISYLRVWLLSHISITDADLGVFQQACDRRAALAAARPGCSPRGE